MCKEVDNPRWSTVHVSVCLAVPNIDYLRLTFVDSIQRRNLFEIRAFVHRVYLFDVLLFAVSVVTYGTEVYPALENTASSHRKESR